MEASVGGLDASAVGPLRFALMKTVETMDGVWAENEDHGRGCTNKFGF